MSLDQPPGGVGRGALRPDGLPPICSYEQAVVAESPVLRQTALALATIDAVIPNRMLLMHRCDADGRLLAEIVVMHAASMRISLDQLIWSYARKYRTIDPTDPTRHVTIGTRMMTTKELGGWEALAPTPIGEFLSLLGMIHGVRLYLRHDGRMVASVAIFRGPGAPDFGEGELALLMRMLPALEHGYGAALSSRGALSDAQLEIDPLTPRERTVAVLAAGGDRTSAIAAQLGISEATVKSHLARAYRKLGVRSRVELAARIRTHPNG